jgi:large conductance mechanosensitive channel
MLSEFRKFIARGNVIDMAVGIVIGAAFTTVVKSLVDDILMPPLGRLTGGMDFTNHFVNLSEGEYASLAAAKEAGAATVNYGLFANNLLSFLIVAVAVFVLVQAYNRMRTTEEAAPLPPSERPCPFCRFTVPVAATRCGHCTSALPDAAIV